MTKTTRYFAYKLERENKRVQYWATDRWSYLIEEAKLYFSEKEASDDLINMFDLDLVTCIGKLSFDDRLDKENQEPLLVDTGLTKREYIATAALQGLLANSNPDFMSFNDESYAKLALEYADALIEQINKTQEEK